MTLVLLSSLLLAVQAPATEPPAGKEVTVVARSRTEATDLAACIARGCPPDQDIAATLALVVSQFVDGDYRAARSTLAASRGRNGRHAKAYPEQVAQLHGTYARMSEHLGDNSRAWSGRLDAVSALKAGLSSDDPRVLSERIALGDGYLFGGRIEAALTEYGGVAVRARKLGLTAVEGQAMLRRASLLVGLVQHGASVRRREAQGALDAMLKRSEPAFASYVTAARTLQVSLNAPKPGATLDRAIADFRPASRIAEPLLLYAPAIDLGNSALTDASSNPMAQVAMTNFEDQWINVAFEIGADGRVGDVIVQNQSAKLAGDWAKSVTKAIAARRYAPMRIANGSTVARLERYTLTSLLETRTGSRISVRDSKPVLQMVDLTN